MGITWIIENEDTNNLLKIDNEKKHKKNNKKLNKCKMNDSKGI